MGEVKLNVILLTYTKDPLLTIARAAKLCYSKSNIKDLLEKTNKKEQEKFIEKLINMGHMSPIEHVSFTFAIEGISRACSHQLVRHRLASYSQQSQRYVSEKSDNEDFDYIIPPSIDSLPEIVKTEYKFFMREEAQRVYDFISEKLKENDMESKANEDARFILPNACETKIIVTMNARQLLHFFNVRCCNRAQWEIRSMAKNMLRLVKDITPIIFKNAGPGCLKGKCPEGKLTCGKIKEIRKLYSY